MELGCCPRTVWVALTKLVSAVRLLVVLGTGLAQGENELAANRHREYREMVPVRTLNHTMNKTKVTANIGKIGNDDFRMSDRILAVLIDVRI